MGGISMTSMEGESEGVIKIGLVEGRDAHSPIANVD